MAAGVWPQIAAHREPLLVIARRRCANREDAEDVVSEAMLRCATFHDLDEERLEAFLIVVTLRLCTDLYRKNERRARAVVKLAADPDVTPGPEEVLFGGLDAGELRVLLAALPAKQRAVLTDRAHGLSVTQIATRHALTYKAAESALARARGAMRAALAATTAALVVVRAWLRPRRVAIAAVPLATLTLAAAALRMPLLDEHRDRPAEGTPYAALRDVALTPRTSADIAVPRRAVAARAAAAPGRARPARVTPPRPPRPKGEIAVGDRRVFRVVVQPQDKTPEERKDFVQMCVEDGVWADFTVRPGALVGEGGSLAEGAQGCGARP
ncbi:MAG TPA: sigma-70 family RNA polymerase sigma factor [Frankiaceae bacterium]|nr:sigma-70 family RNA polymerase sigma factor [Frankiaceae bacterium]